MSYIDGFDHEYIGSLGYLPLYHPIAPIQGDGWAMSDFSADASNLVLGGGSGEHPALVIHHLDALVAFFIDEQFTEQEQEQLKTDDLNKLIDLKSSENIFEFCDWKVRHYAQLQQMAECSAMNSPLTEDEELEDWLASSLGELIYFSLPELCHEYSWFKHLVKDQNIFPSRANIRILPPGYPQPGGRVFVNNKMQWGINYWQNNHKSYE